VDWSNVMTELPLPQRVGKTVGGGWGYFFIGMHITLNGWMVSWGQKFCRNLDPSTTA